MGLRNGLIIIYKYIIIRISENYFKLIFLASLLSAYLRRRYSLILSLFFSKYSCFCTHTIEGLSCFHCLAYSFILSLSSSLVILSLLFVVIFLCSFLYTV